MTEQKAKKKQKKQKNNHMELETKTLHLSSEKQLKDDSYILTEDLLDDLDQSNKSELRFFVLQYLVERFKLNRESSYNSKYYYQFEYDSQKTFYENLMGLHLIAIQASSEAEANIMNVVLRSLIDGHCNIVLDFFYDKNRDFVKSITLKDLYYNIIASDCMSMYQEYKVTQPYDIVHTRIIENGYMYTFSDTPTIFNFEMVAKSLYDPEMHKKYSYHRDVQDGYAKYSRYYHTFLVPTLLKVELTEKSKSF